MVVRCSSLDRVMTCSGSLIEPACPVDYPIQIGVTGTAGHLVLSRVIGEGADPETAIDDVCAADSSLDRSDIDFLVSEALRAWASIGAGSFKPAMTEFPLHSRLTRGTADVVRIGDGEALVVDWKMGYGTDRHDAQLTGYAAGVAELLARRPDLGAVPYVRTVEVHVRHGQWYERHVTHEQLADFAADLERRMSHPARQWAPGRACTYCPSRHECDARARWLRNSVELLGDAMALGPTREAMAALYELAGGVQSALAQYWSAFNALLDDGPLTLPGGLVAQWSEVRREEIDLAKAWPILRAAGLDAETILSTTKVTKKALKPAIENGAPRGQKKKRSDAVFKSLRDENAIKSNTTQTRSIKRSRSDNDK